MALRPGILEVHAQGLDRSSMPSITPWPLGCPRRPLFCRTLGRCSKRRPPLRAAEKNTRCLRTARPGKFASRGAAQARLQQFFGGQAQLKQFRANPSEDSFRAQELIGSGPGPSSDGTAAQRQERFLLAGLLAFPGAGKINAHVLFFAPPTCRLATLCLPRRKKTGCHGRRRRQRRRRGSWGGKDQ